MPGIACRFNDGQLPLWVTKSANDESALISESNTRKMMPKGRWAQRMTPFTPDGILHLPSSEYVVKRANGVLTHYSLLNSRF